MPGIPFSRVHKKDYTYRGGARPRSSSKTGLCRTKTCALTNYGPSRKPARGLQRGPYALQGFSRRYAADVRFSSSCIFILFSFHSYVFSFHFHFILVSLLLFYFGFTFVFILFLFHFGFTFIFIFVHFHLPLQLFRAAPRFPPTSATRNHSLLRASVSVLAKQQRFQGNWQANIMWASSLPLFNVRARLKPDSSANLLQSMLNRDNFPTVQKVANPRSSCTWHMFSVCKCWPPLLDIHNGPTDAFSILNQTFNSRCWSILCSWPSLITTFSLAQW